MKVAQQPRLKEVGEEERNGKSRKGYGLVYLQIHVKVFLDCYYPQIISHPLS